MQNFKRMLTCLALMAPGLLIASSEAPIPPAYVSIASTYGIPEQILYAVALAESGRSVPGITLRRPWPWSANFGGEGRYFDSRAAAFSAIQAYIDSGKRSVDIGLMQVNWRYHRSSLKSVWDALDPYHNLHIAAGILNDCYGRHRDWWLSVGCYHSPSNQKRAEQYRARVRAQWDQLQ